MGIADIPATSDAFRAFREKFEAERMVFADSNRAVAMVTVDLVLGMYVPRLLYPLGRPVAMALCSERLVAAIGARQPPRLLRRIVHAAMRLRGKVSRYSSGTETTSANNQAQESDLPERL